MYNADMQKLTGRLYPLALLVLGVGLFLFGLYTMSYLVNNVWPVDTGRTDLIRAIGQQRVTGSMLLAASRSDAILAMLAAAGLAAAGLTLPIAYYLNKRFARDLRDGAPPSLWVVLRQAALFGAWVAFCVWLQLNRTLGFAVALLAAVVIILLEVILQIRSRVSAAEKQHVT